MNSVLSSLLAPVGAVPMPVVSGAQLPDFNMASAGLPMAILPVQIAPGKVADIGPEGHVGEVMPTDVAPTNAVRFLNMPSGKGNSAPKSGETAHVPWNLKRFLEAPLPIPAQPIGPDMPLLQEAEAKVESTGHTDRDLAGADAAIPAPAMQTDIAAMTAIAVTANISAPIAKPIQAETVVKNAATSPDSTPVPITGISSVIAATDSGAPKPVETPANPTKPRIVDGSKNTPRIYPDRNLPKSPEPARTVPAALADNPARTISDAISVVANAPVKTPLLKADTARLQIDAVTDAASMPLVQSQANLKKLPERMAIAYPDAVSPLGDTKTNAVATDLTLSPSNIPGRISDSNSFEIRNIGLPSANPLIELSGAGQIAQRHLDLAREGLWLDDLSRDIVAASSPDRISFRLSPPHLGELDIDLSTSVAGLVVNMTASTDEATQIVALAQPSLVESLQSQGVRVADTQVTTGNDGGRHGQSPRQGVAHLIDTGFSGSDEPAEQNGKAAAGRFA